MINLKEKKNLIYVANHTSLIDFMVLTQDNGFATVGQSQGGVVGFLQNILLKPLENIWFERFETRDRRLVQDRISKHINDLKNPPLLIFPEGVCVNNEYCVMFKKGVFEIPDVEIVPIAIKYDKTWSDPYWSSRDESFLRHLLRLMKSWCTVCSIYYLDPVKIRKGETSIEFSMRVKDSICKKAGLINLPWDGYLKYYSPSKKLLEKKQEVLAEVIKNKMLVENELKNYEILENKVDKKKGDK